MQFHPLRFSFTFSSLLASLATFANADVTLPSIFAPGMVLQRDKAAPVWGKAEPGENVIVSFAGQSKSTTAGADGRWQVALDPLPASAEPRALTVKGNNTIELGNVLVGEVWLGSGQSNMQWSVAASMNAQEEIAAANYPNIRLFSVPLVTAAEPQFTVNATWAECKPETVKDFSAVLYYMGRTLHKDLNVPVGLIGTSWGGTRIEPWTPIEGFEQVESQKELAAKLKAEPNAPVKNNQQPTVLYNSMIHPLIPYAIRGAVWYQGESNNGEGMLYLDKKKALVGGWRKLWNQGDFPFYFVQLAPFNYGNKPAEEARQVTSLAEIWEAQAAAVKEIPHTGMAVINDIGDLKDIHPVNKQEVGRRLALIALAKDYGKQDVEYSGPVFREQIVEGSKIRLKFDHARGLKSRDGKPLDWFEIAGEDGNYVPAEAVIDGEDVLVSSPRVERPASVRFAWSQMAEPNLANAAGLPASAFRTKR